MDHDSERGYTPGRTKGRDRCPEDEQRPQGDNHRGTKIDNNTGDDMTSGSTGTNSLGEKPTLHGVCMYWANMGWNSLFGHWEVRFAVPCIIAV